MIDDRDMAGSFPISNGRVARGAGSSQRFITLVGNPSGHLSDELEND